MAQLPRRPRLFPRKGIGLTFPNRDADRPSRAASGDASELGDAGGSSGKSSLFLLTGRPPGIRLAGDRVVMPGKAPHLLWRPVRSPTVLENPRERSDLSRPVVPITASGLQGEQPLVDRTM